MSKKHSKPEQDRVIENRKARHDYFITETLETGVQLVGTEVKAVRDGKVSLGEGFVRVEERTEELFLHGVNIGEYAPGGTRQHAATRVRKLLAHKREIRKLAKASAAKGMTLVPLKMYFKNGYAKVLIGVAEGRAAHDKRDRIAKRDAERSIARAMSKRM
ncbi:MAG: SsrA-binding protein SmpB [Phycisphaerales bacterium]